MPTITALEVQQRNKRRLNVYLDHAFGFGIAANAAVALRVGQELTAADIARLEGADAAEVAYERALRFLSYRPRAEREVARNLQKHRVPETIITTVLERLRAANYVNDVEFAQLWVENRAEHRPRGRRALRAELRQKGVADDIIEDAIADVDELSAAQAVAEKHAPRLKGLPRIEFRQKLYGRLARRGFGGETIRTVIDEIIENAQVDEADA